jgi:hypothetical protein
VAGVDTVRSWPGQARSRREKGATVRRTVNTLSDRVLGLFLPAAKAGACACSPGEGGQWQYRCYLGQENQKRWCYYNCYCNWVCNAWVYIGDC